MESAYFVKWSKTPAVIVGFVGHFGDVKEDHILIRSSTLPNIAEAVLDQKPEQFKDFLSAHDILIENRTAKILNSENYRKIQFDSFNTISSFAYVFRERLICFRGKSRLMISLIS